MESSKSAALERILQLEQAAVESYALAIDALGDESLRDELRPLRDSHRHRQQQLIARIVALRGAPRLRGRPWREIRAICRDANLHTPKAQLRLVRAIADRESALDDAYMSDAQQAALPTLAVNFLSTYVMPEQNRTRRELGQLLERLVLAA